MPTITDTIDQRFDYPERVRALMVNLGLNRWTQIDEESYNNCAFSTPDGDYEVLTDEEADERWEESLDSYIDDCIMPELPEPLASYFDVEAWKRDARIDGRGHAINHYDGGEDWGQDPETGEDFYIYRTN